MLIFLLGQRFPGKCRLPSLLQSFGVAPAALGRALGHEAAPLLLSAPHWRACCQPSPLSGGGRCQFSGCCLPLPSGFSAPMFLRLDSLTGSRWLCVDFILLMTRDQAVVLKLSFSKSVPRPAVSASPGNLLEVQILRATSGLLDRKL